MDATVGKRGVEKQVPGGQLKPRQRVGLKDVGRGAACMRGPGDALHCNERRDAHLNRPARRILGELAGGAPDGVGQQGARRLLDARGVPHPVHNRGY